MSKPIVAPWTLRWRLSLVAATVAIVAAACGGAFWIVETKGEEAIAAQERQALASELDLFADVQRDEGDVSLLRALERRARLATGQRIYALRAADGHILGGDLATWPAIGGNERWAPFDAELETGPAHAATRQLAHGLTVLVGRDDKALRDFRHDVFDALWAALTIVAATCLALSALATNFILHRVRRLSDVAMRVSAGDFSARAPGAAEAGPFGDIAKAQNAMLDRIEMLITGLRTVTDSLAHDLRTPLARTRRGIEQGLIATSDAAKQAALEGALADTDRTIALFAALVDVARADSGLSRDAMTMVDLAQVAEDVADLFEPLAAERGIELRADIAPVFARAHKPLLMQSVSNLVHNAIKYAPADGRVTLRLLRSDVGAEFVVSDHGPGIPADRRDDAVRRFKRVGVGDEGDGLGLGLAIADSCARLHGGALVLEDNAPGLRVRLRLAETSP